MVRTEINSAVKGKMQSNKDTVFLVSSLLISAISLCLLIGPTYAGVLAVQEKNAEKEKDLQNKQELLAKVKAFNRENGDTAADSKKLESFISNRNNYEDYFFHLEDLAKQSNLEITSMQLQAKNDSASSAVPANEAAAAGAATDASGGAGSQAGAAATQLKEQYINLSVRGSFDNMAYFYKNLENGIPFLQEVSSEVSYDQQAEGSSVPSAGEGQNLNPILQSKMSLKFNYY